LIIWITGNTGAGKTTLAKTLQTIIQDSIILDGNSMRKSISIDLGLSKEDRIENNLRIARLATKLEEQGFNIIVSVIAPYEELRKQIKKITDCKFIYIPSSNKIEYEVPKNPDLVYQRGEV